MMFDELVSKVDPTETDRKLVGRRVLEVIAAMGMTVDEASGRIVRRDVMPSYVPQEQNIRFAGMRTRGRRR